MTKLTTSYLLTPFRPSDFFQMMWGTSVCRQHNDRSPGHSGILCGAPQVLQCGFVSKRVSHSFQIYFTFLSYPTLRYSQLMIRNSPASSIGVTTSIRHGDGLLMTFSVQWMLWLVIAKMIIWRSSLIWSGKCNLQYIYFTTKVPWMKTRFVISWSSKFDCRWLKNFRQLLLIAELTFLCSLQIILNKACCCSEAFILFI